MRVIIIGILLMIVILSLILGFFLLMSSSKKKLSNYLLSFYLIVVGIQMFGNLFSYILNNSARYSQYNSALSFLLPPVLYLYGISVLETKWKFTSREVIHFIPSFIAVMFTMNNISLPAEHRVLLYLSFIIYTTLIFSKLYFPSKSRRASMHQKISWLKNIFSLFTLIFLFDIIYFFGFPFLGKVSVILEFLILSLIALFNFYIVQNITRTATRRKIFQIKRIMPKLAPKKKNLCVMTVDYEHEKIYELNIYMAKETPFVNPELTLVDLSLKIGIPSRELSELINGHLGTNFISYVNSYRINMAKQLLSNPEEIGLNISEIMYEVGFSSRSSFNTLFKKETGMTPSEFREGLLYRPTNPKPIIQRLQ